MLNYSSFSFFYKINFFRKYLTYIRLFYLVKVLKRVNTLSLNKESIAPLSIESNLRVLIPNKDLPHFDKIKYVFGLGTNIAGYKSSMLLTVVDSIYSALFIDKKLIKMLIIGPRTEGEIFLSRGFGYLKHNIDAIDLFSYSHLIRLGDMHNIPAQNDSYDLILCGWVLAYSDDKKLAISEIVRVCKDQAIVCIGASYLATTPEEQKLKRGYVIGSTDKFFSSSDIIKLFDGYNIEILFNVDSSKSLNHSQILLIIRINK